VDLQQKAKEDSAVHRLNKIKLDQVRPTSLSILCLAITLLIICLSLVLFEGHLSFKHAVHSMPNSPFICSVTQENRVHTLRKEADHCISMAELIEYNLEDVDAAITAVRVSLANGMSWEALTRMIKEERKAGNPVAGLIDKLSFEKNCISLLLSNNLDDMDEDEKTAPVEKVCSTNT
jgi:hypothetical protein